jgi:hypothetical protein
VGRVARGSCWYTAVRVWVEWLGAVVGILLLVWVEWLGAVVGILLLETAFYDGLLKER